MNTAIFNTPDIVSVLLLQVNVSITPESNSIYAGSTYWLISDFLQRPSKADLLHRAPPDEEESDLNAGKMVTNYEGASYSSERPCNR